MRSQYTYRRTSFFNSYFPAGVKWLIIVNVAMFLLTAIFGLPRILELTPIAVIESYTVFQLVTYLFLHGGISHLLFNMIALWMFGTPLEQTWGTKAFLKYYFFCGIGAGICDILLHAVTHTWNTSTLGASGAIYGLLLAFGVLFPNQTVLMDFLFPIKAKYLVMIYGAIALFMAFRTNDNISSIAHLGGMIFGLIYLKVKMPRLALPDWRFAYKQWKLRRNKKKFQVYMKKHGDRGGPWVN
jgi:membrane associated rhomboid family serine protease